MDPTTINENELDTKVNDTPAGASLHPNSHPVPASKTELLAAAVAVMGGMQHGDLSKFLESLKQIGHEADLVPGSAEKNRSTITPKGDAKSAMKEDIIAAFKGMEDITEETLEQVTTLFEAALGYRLGLEVARIEEEYDTQYNDRLAESIEKMNEEITGNVNDYLSYVAEEWLKENRIEVENQIKTDIAMNVLKGIKGVFEENYIKVPKKKVDVVEDLSAQLKEKNDKLDATILENIELKKTILNSKKKLVVDGMAEGLSANEVEKFKTLSESVEFADEADLVKKLTTIKESYFIGSKGVKSGVTLTEDGLIVDVEAPKDENADSNGLSGEMKEYFNAIRQSVKN